MLAWAITSTSLLVISILWLISIVNGQFKYTDGLQDKIKSANDELDRSRNEHRGAYKAANERADNLQKQYTSLLIKCKKKTAKIQALQDEIKYLSGSKSDRFKSIGADDGKDDDAGSTVA